MQVLILTTCPDPEQECDSRENAITPQTADKVPVYKVKLLVKKVFQGLIIPFYSNFWSVIK